MQPKESIVLNPLVGLAIAEELNEIATINAAKRFFMSNMPHSI
jgi:hypothetical protein